MHYDVVIIGAGMSGLAAGLRLAQFQKRVLIVEQHRVAGGLNSYYHRDGHVLDVGLHAVTNTLKTGYRGPRIPMQRVLRQLRLSPEDFALEPQTRSAIRYGEVQLDFSNDLAELQASIAERFPKAIDGFIALSRRLAGYPPPRAPGASGGSGRALLEAYLPEPQLVAMLLLPLLFYGSAREHDVDEDQLQILFNSIYVEGLSRPRDGVRTILFHLLRRFREAGGKLQKSTRVEAIVHDEGRVQRLELSRGPSVHADWVISTAGRAETLRLFQSERQTAASEPTSMPDPGQLSFVEHMWRLDRPARELGFDRAITFYHTGEGDLGWHRPKIPVEVKSGVVCVPANFNHQKPLTEQLLRATHLADHGAFMNASEADYAALKAKGEAASRTKLEALFGPFSGHILDFDGFSPKTLWRYTGHDHGAVYGIPDKSLGQTMPLSNLALAGTDQGFVGIIGSMLSGINVANATGLR